MAEYTPSETEVRDDYVAWEYAPERKAEFDRFLARVRRDAAREALDGLIDAWLGEYGTPETRDSGVAVRDYREMNYRTTETEDQM